MRFLNYKGATAPQSTALQAHKIDATSDAIEAARRRAEIVQLLGASAQGYGYFAKETGKDPIADYLRKTFGDSRINPDGTPAAVVPAGATDAEATLAVNGNPAMVDVVAPPVPPADAPPSAVPVVDAVPMAPMKPDTPLGAPSAPSALPAGVPPSAVPVVDAVPMKAPGGVDPQQAIPTGVNPPPTAAPTADQAAISDVLRNGDGGAAAATTPTVPPAGAEGAKGLSGADALGYANMAAAAASGDEEALARAALQKYLASLGPYGWAAAAATSFV